MPTGGHEILPKTREAVEARAHMILAQLEESGADNAVDKERAGSRDR